MQLILIYCGEIEEKTKQAITFWVEFTAPLNTRSDISNVSSMLKWNYIKIYDK